ncbi:ABC transporter permease [Streptosporangium sp. NPDC048047]|uniref:ABC transporter permease n=1 Tax=Streptosporangium sp. NPDC048047 TaxID=3155748 RepID=UPI00341C11E6
MTLSAQAQAPDGGAEQGMTIVARTQAQMVRRRFFRHRAALAGMIVFGLVLVLAFSSIGFAGIPGWWHQSYITTGALVNQGKPTLSLSPFTIGDHPFGQDDIGVDYFAKSMRGAQQSIIVAFLVGIVATVVGAVVGAVAGYYRGRVEAVLMRVTDVMITIPVLVIAAVLGRKFGDAGVVPLGIVLGLTIWPTMARLLRGEFLSLREKEFVEAARAVGTPARRIIFRHILPNTIGVIVVSATLATANAVLLESALSFLGLGVQPPDTSLGQLINEYRTAFSTRPWLFWWPGIFIIAIALSINFIGDGLRDAFDPRQTRVRA